MSGRMMPALPDVRKLTLAEALRCAKETRVLLVGSGVVSEVGRVFREQFPGAKAVVVTDENTYPLAARVITDSLKARGVACAEPFVFHDPQLYAASNFVEQLETSLRGHDAIPIALGSGTINDVVKLASHRLAREGYLCVATAASMDGYTAYGASITHDGAKQTFNCPAPRAVIADLEIIRRAPAEMTAAGYADLSAKVTAGADWILADALGEEAVDLQSWTIVQGGLRDALADPAGARNGETAAVAPLVEGLILGGFAMQWSRTSRPASGAEHQFSHLWDMEHHIHQGSAPSHGFKVGIATLAVTRLYEQLLAHDIAALDIGACVAAWRDADAIEEDIRQRFAGTDFVETAVSETRAKYISREALREQLATLKATWREICARLHAQLLPAEDMKRRLELVGAPTEPEQIGITRERLRETFRRAYHIRRRFTVLDVAARTALLDPMLDGIFGRGAPWEISSARAANFIP